MASKEEIRKFLLNFKQVASSRGVDIVPRAGTLHTLSFLGLTKKNLEEILLGLSVLDYSKGPVEDKDKGGMFWIFGKDMDDYEVYVKLKIAVIDDDHIAKCISFHIAKFPIEYPFK